MGCHLGVVFGLLDGQVRPKSAQNVCRKLINIKDVNFHQILRPLIPERYCVPQDVLQNVPRSPQDGSKTVLEGHFGHVKTRTDFLCVLGPILDRSGCQNAFLLAPLEQPKSVKKPIENWTALNVTARSPQDRPKPPQERPKSSQEPPRPPQDTQKCSQEAPSTPKKA